jgi:hypothetical protein
MPENQENSSMMTKEMTTIIDYPNKLHTGQKPRVQANLIL